MKRKENKDLSFFLSFLFPMNSLRRHPLPIFGVIQVSRLITQTPWRSRDFIPQWSGNQKKNICIENSTTSHERRRMLGWTDPEVDSDLLPSVTSSPKGRPGRCLSMACQSIYKSTDTNDNHQHHSKPALRISLYYLFRYLNMILMNRVSQTTTRHIFLRH